MENKEMERYAPLLFHMASLTWFGFLAKSRF